MLHLTSTHLPLAAALRTDELNSLALALMVTAQTTLTTATYQGLHGMNEHASAIPVPTPAAHDALILRTSALVNLMHVAVHQLHRSKEGSARTG